MTLDDIKKEVKKHISNGDTGGALTLLTTHIHPDSSYHDEVILLRASYEPIMKGQRLATTSGDELRRETNRINSSILALIKLLQEEDIVKEMQASTTASAKEVERTALREYTNPSEVNWPDMVHIPGGTFQMGDVMEDNEVANEKPIHSVTLSDFYLGRYAVTFAEFDTFCEAIGRKKPGDEGWGRERRPVINVSWYDAVDYCNWLSQQHGYTPVYDIQGDEVRPNWTANGYRLPTEAEWEYAARERGGKLRFGNGKNTADAKEINFYAENHKKEYSVVGERRGKTVPVGSLEAPNRLGLHDMSGNVWEWCWDWFVDYTEEAQTNPLGPEQGSTRVGRGGSWGFYFRYCRVAYRNDWNPANSYNFLGFRLARLA